MYKLLNKIFGWDYIYWRNTCDGGISRVFITPDGKVSYWRYKITNILDEIKKPDDVIWLTCNPNKYFDVLK